MWIFGGGKAEKRYANPLGWPHHDTLFGDECPASDYANFALNQLGFPRL
jgi:hypothetical protein